MFRTTRAARFSVALLTGAAALSATPSFAGASVDPPVAGVHASATATAPVDIATLEVWFAQTGTFSPVTGVELAAAAAAVEPLVEATVVPRTDSIQAGPFGGLVVIGERTAIYDAYAAIVTAVQGAVPRLQPTRLVGLGAPEQCAAKERQLSSAAVAEASLNAHRSVEGTGLERSRTITRVEVSVLTAPGGGACAETLPPPDFFKARQIRSTVLASVVAELAGSGEPTILFERRTALEQPASFVEVAVDVVDAAERVALAQRLADAGLPAGSVVRSNSRVYIRTDGPSLLAVKPAVLAALAPPADRPPHTVSVHSVADCAAGAARLHGIQRAEADTLAASIAAAAGLQLGDLRYLEERSAPVSAACDQFASDLPAWTGVAALTSTMAFGYAAS